jgi:MoaA/NifB/PqqE/SkfB family radical SAM enzyme
LLTARKAEAVYLACDRPADLPEIGRYMVKKLLNRTSRLVFAIDYEEFKQPAIREMIRSIGIKNLCLKMPYHSEQSLNVIHAGGYTYGDEEIAARHSYWKEHCPEFELSYEFDLLEDMRLLGPTIDNMANRGVTWIVLNPTLAPTTANISQIKNFFDYLRMKGWWKLNVYFSFLSPERDFWQLQTLNTFSGLKHVHIDISNRCTHSCVFCSLYSEDAIAGMKQLGNGTMPPAQAAFMRMELDKEKFYQIVSSLPMDVETVQLGGYGDPLMHESAVDFMCACLDRGFRVEVLSNMEYLTTEQLVQLSESVSSRGQLTFIANISGGTYELYNKTRPKQQHAAFTKVKQNLEFITKSDKGYPFAHVTVMCVVNALNCTQLETIVEFAHEVGAREVWFKPMEPQVKEIAKYIPLKENYPSMKESLAKAIDRARDYQISIINLAQYNDFLRG